MTPQEMIDALNDAGENSGGAFHDGLGGYFGWGLVYENGDLVLKSGFSDPEAPILDTELEWILTPKKRS